MTASETGDGRHLNEERVKDVTGGGVVTARFMRAEWFEYTPLFKVVLCTNHLPKIRGTEHAIWRRIRLVPFSVTIPEKEQDRDLAAKLRDELPGVLAWLIRGCLDWQRDGLDEPASVRAATADYRTDMDVIGRFLDECCVAEPSAQARSGDLWSAFCGWCERNRENTGTQTSFGRQLTERGFEPLTGGIRVRSGIRLGDPRR